MTKKFVNKVAVKNKHASESDGVDAQAEITVQPLDFKNTAQCKACAALLVEAFNADARYSAARISQELKPSASPFYRHFFIALQGKTIVGAAGVKSADWASQTHVLYLSAVHQDYRGLGIARKLIAARMEWRKENHVSGRALVSSAKLKRFSEFGFKPMRASKLENRLLLLHTW